MVRADLMSGDGEDDGGLYAGTVCARLIRREPKDGW